MRRLPSLNWLRVFESAARHQSFARAATELNMSAPAVSQQTRALETHLKTDLFVRGAQAVHLTPAARDFLPVVHQALASVETTATALFGDPGAAQVSLQAVGLVALGWLPPVLAGFVKAHPGVAISLSTGNHREDFLWQTGGRPADLQILFGNRTDWPETAVPLFGETLGMVGPPDVARRITSPQALSETVLYEVASHRAGWHHVLSQWPEMDLRDLTIRIVDNTPLAMRMAGATGGLALNRMPAAGDLSPSFGLEPCALPHQVAGLQHYALVQTGPSNRNTAQTKLAEWLTDQAVREI